MAAGLLAVGLLAGWDAGAPAEAKTPGSTYCFLSVCHRVKSLQEIQDLVGKREQLRTSFYDSCSRDRFNPCGLTSSGEAFRPGQADNAASPIYPDGTTLLLWHPQTQEAAVVRVNNAGPYWGERKLDVSRATAEKLGFKGSGTAKLEVEVVKAPAPGEANYRRNRKVRARAGPYRSLRERGGGARRYDGRHGAAGDRLVRAGPDHRRGALRGRRRPRGEQPGSCRRRSAGGEQGRLAHAHGDAERRPGEGRGRLGAHAHRGRDFARKDAPCLAHPIEGRP